MIGAGKFAVLNESALVFLILVVLFFFSFSVFLLPSPFFSLCPNFGDLYSILFIYGFPLFPRTFEYIFFEPLLAVWATTSLLFLIL